MTMPTEPKGTVYLLHGLMRTQLSMAPLAVSLRRGGWRVRNCFYPSRSRTIEEHADRLLERIRRTSRPDEGPFHFVTHSLGGIVVRCALARCEADQIPLSAPGRFVMIAPPNRGSPLARRLSGTLFWDAIFGRRAFHQLGDESLADAWGTPPMRFGVIAGGRGDGRGWNPLLTGDDDGVVSVEDTHLPGESGHIVLRSIHAVLPWRQDCMRQVVSFLQSGRFATIPRDDAPMSKDRRTTR